MLCFCSSLSFCRNGSVWSHGAIDDKFIIHFGSVRTFINRTLKVREMKCENGKRGTILHAMKIRDMKM